MGAGAAHRQAWRRGPGAVLGEKTDIFGEHRKKRSDEKAKQPFNRLASRNLPAPIEGSSSRARKGLVDRVTREIEDKVNDLTPREDKDVTFETLNRQDFLDAIREGAVGRKDRGGDCSSRPRLGQANASSRRECKRLWSQ